MRAQLAVAAPLAEVDVTFLRYAGLTRGDKAAGGSDSPSYYPPAGTVVKAIVNAVDLATQERLGGREVAGDAVFQIRTSVLADKPGPNDRIVWSGAQFMPFQVTEARVQGALFWVVRCRKN